MDPDDVEVAARLRAAWDSRADKSLTQEAAAARMGMTQSGVSQYLTGRIPVGLEAALKFAALLGIKAEEINPRVADLFRHVTPEVGSPHPRLRPIVEWKNADELDPNQHVILPRLEVHLSAGNGDGPRDSEPAAYNAGQAYRADFVKRKGWSPKTHFSMYVKGDSMEPTIPDGSVVVIDISDKRIRSGSIYAVKVDDELRLKRLHKLPGGVVRVESDNPAPRYKAFEVGGETAKGFKVIGRAVNLTTDL